MNLPEDYVTEMKRLLKEDFPRYEESLTEPRFFGLRVNTLKITPEEFVKIAPFDLEPVPWIKNGFYYGGTYFYCTNYIRHTYRIKNSLMAFRTTNNCQ